MNAQMMIDANHYEQLILLTWDRQNKMMTEEEAYRLYQAKDKSRWVEPENMDPKELAFFTYLVDTYGNGVFVRYPPPMLRPQGEVKYWRTDAARKE